MFSAALSRQPIPPQVITRKAYPTETNLDIMYAIKHAVTEFCMLRTLWSSSKPEAYSWDC